MGFEIIGEKSMISFESYCNKLLEIHRDCRREEYMSEAILPLLRMCCPAGVKVVPVFDDRAVGKKSKDETARTRVMKAIGAQKPNNNGYVVPDYIFVPDNYSYDAPKSPFLMVETKLPNIIEKEDGSLLYADDLSRRFKSYKSELSAEIKACGCVIFTDGFSWMFLEERDGNIIQSEQYKTICLLNREVYRQKIEKASLKAEKKHMDLSFIGGGAAETKHSPKEWENIPSTIEKLIIELKKE